MSDLDDGHLFLDQTTDELIYLQDTNVDEMLSNLNDTLNGIIHDFYQLNKTLMEGMDKVRQVTREFCPKYIFVLGFWPPIAKELKYAINTQEVIMAIISFL